MSPEPWLLHRRVIAEAVAADPDTYTEGLLEKTNEAYCAWILDKQRWGGGIELSILSTCAGQITGFEASGF